MAKKRILILGAGLAGLSAAWHLQKKGIDCQVFEKEPEVGGLCRSKNIAGFSFDYCGHLLHFKHRYTFNLIRELLDNNLLKHKKSAWIYSYDRLTRYPFQINLYGLPSAVTQECLLGFIQANGNGRSRKKTNLSFLDWINQTFGKGITRHFMVPYNTKFWTVSPSELTCEWLDGFIPVPSLRQLIEGTIQENERSFGYNAIFWYPKKGRIQEIPQVFSSRIKGIRTLYEATRLDIKNKEVYFKNGARFKYGALIFTVPLPEILNLTKNLPDEVTAYLKSLRYNSIFNLNLGIDNKHALNKHWIYFPEKKFIFYRIGFPGNFSPESSPRNTSSLYIEVAYSKEKPIDKKTIADKIMKDLMETRILNPSDRILVKDANDIKYGYIIYDQARHEALKHIKTFLHKNNIFCLGRYGSWSYMSMEDVLLEGKRIAGIL